MIPNVEKGKDTRGLLRYLVGPGKRNEHSNPHLVAGDPVVTAWYGRDELSAADAAEIARTIDAPMAMLEQVRPNAKLTWHCSLALGPDEPALTDEQWGAIATDFMRRMGWDLDEEGHARWVAVHHGTTVAGGDHIHIAASRVREDGRVVSIANDFRRAQAVCAELEREYGLRILTSRETGRSQRAEVAGEAEIAARAGYAEKPREALARLVRACAGAAMGDEAEFVRAMRREGLLVSPFYTPGERDQVAGYSVALRLTDAQREAGEKPRYIGGGKLGRDLTLQALRNAWGRDETVTPPAAAAEWWAAKRQQAIVAERVDVVVITQARVTATAAELERIVAELAKVPPGDTAQWALVSSRASWTMSALAAHATGTERAHLRASAKALGAAGQTRAYVRRDPSLSLPTEALATAAMLVMASRRSPELQWIALMSQLAALTQAIFHAQRAAHELHLARSLRDAEVARVRAVAMPGHAPVAAVSAPTVQQARGGLHEDLWRGLAPPSPGRGSPGGQPAPTWPTAPGEVRRGRDGPATDR